MNYAEEIIKMKKNTFEAFLTMVLVRGSDKRKYGELIHDFCIQYGIKNYPLSPAVYLDVDSS